jgi:DNA polymerase III epsilon subunit-like protein
MLKRNNIIYIMIKKLCFINIESNGEHTITENVSKKNLYGFAQMLSFKYVIGYFIKDKFIKEIEMTEIVKPEYIYINDEVSQKTGITNEYANENGINIETILLKFKENIKKVSIIVGHNIDKQIKTLLSEYIRYNINIDLSNYVIVDTYNFNNNYNCISLYDLGNKMKIDNNNILDLLVNIFIKLYNKLTILT